MKTAIDNPAEVVELASDSAPNSHPRWSPRGDWIAFQSGAETLVVSPDGRQRKKIADGGVSRMAWSKDGATVYGTRRGELLAVDVDSGRIRKLREIPAGLIPYRQQGSLTPDGQGLVMARAILEGDIWVMEGLTDAPGTGSRVGNLLPERR